MAEVARTELDTSAMREYAKYLKQAPRITQEEIERSMLEALLLLEREIKDATPVGAHGLLRGSYTHALRGAARGEVVGEVGSPLNYALPVELGTKPHFPPVAALRDWVEKKLGVDPARSASVAFLVARKIAKRGTKGAKMATNTFANNAQQVLQILEAAVPRIAARLQAGER